jgi:FtsP/CotA-like multicopper oxidase with cupredoxin domain
VRLYLTNASNARVFNLSIDGATMKLVGADGGLFEREEWVSSIVIAPAERYVVDVRFEHAGRSALVNRIRALDHMLGTFSEAIDTLGVFTVRQTRQARSLATQYDRLRPHPSTIADLAPFRRYTDRMPDKILTLELRTKNLAPIIAAMLTGVSIPIDWNDGMPMVNWATTGREVEWIIRDDATGRENMAVDWQFKVGQLVKVRIVNDPTSGHSMDHPIHLHGQRFLVLARDGRPSANLVWRDTALIPSGTTVDLLVEMSNPGRWMLHCHIAEHLEAGMHTMFEVR